MKSRIRQGDCRVTVKQSILFLFLSLSIIVLLLVFNLGQFPPNNTADEPTSVISKSQSLVSKRVQDPNKIPSAYESALKYSLENIRRYLSEKNFNWFPFETRGLTEQALYGIRNGVIFLQSLNTTNVDKFINKLKSHDNALTKEIVLFLDNKGKLRSLKEKLIAAAEDMEEIVLNTENIPLKTNFKGYKISKGNHSTVPVSMTVPNSYLQMPAIGFGTKDKTGPKCKEAVFNALKAGYRRLDTAVVYENAKSIAGAIEEYKISRSSLFIVSKYPPSRFGDDVSLFIRNHMQALGTNYLDLVLLHAAGPDSESNLSLRHKAWSELEKLHQEGLIKALGVANFNLAQLKLLMEKATVKPQVLQNKFDVYHPGHLQCKDSINNLLTYCQEHSILIDAHSPLSGWPFLFPTLNESHVQAIARVHQRTPAQVILRWILQKGYAVVTSSVNPQHISENISIFDFGLSEEEVQRIDGVSWFVVSGTNCPASGFDNVYGVEWPKNE